MDGKSRQAIISAYGKVLQFRVYSCGREADLPYAKKIIRQAIAEELLMSNNNEKQQNALELGFLELDSFIPDEEFKPIKAFEENLRKGQEMVRREASAKADPMKLAKMLSSHPFPKNIQKHISQQMKERLEQLRALKTLSEIWKG